MLPEIRRPELEPIAEETFCCGYKRCPTARKFADGSLEIEDEGQTIRFTREQVEGLADFLARRDTHPQPVQEGTPP